MTNWARIERHRLCDLLDQVGPDAPTLCGDWRTRELAAHLILRDRRPDAALGIVLNIGPLRRHTASVQRQLADPSRDWATTVDTIRQGPPRWSPMRLPRIERAANTVEFFVHHEDVRRGDANPLAADPAGVAAVAEASRTQPRPLEADLTRTLIAALRRFGRLLRRTPVDLELRLADGEVIVGRKAQREAGASQATGTVVVTGEAGELLLFAYGRQEAAVVAMTGAESQTTAVRHAAFGI